MICEPLASNASTVIGPENAVPGVSVGEVTVTVLTTPSRTTLKCGEEPAAMLNVALLIARRSLPASSSEKVYATDPVGAGIETVQVSPASPVVQSPPAPVVNGTFIGLNLAIAGGSMAFPSIEVMSTSSCVLPGET